MKFDRSLLPLLFPVGAAAIAVSVLAAAALPDAPGASDSVMPPARRVAVMATAAVEPVAAATEPSRPAASEPPADSRAAHPVIPPAPLDRIVPPGSAATAPPPAAPPVAEAKPAPAPAPTSPAPTPSAPRFAAAELDQLLAPIALYPDKLLSQILMASTYPLEVIAAARWVAVPANRKLKGEALVAALRDKHWEPSVMALVPFPHVLEMLCAQLEWTQKLGSAVVAQQADVMDSVQRLRKQAMASGRFLGGPQCQCVVATDAKGYVSVAPARPRLVYVPVYDPVWVYGPWPYPAYPPVVFPVPVGFAWYAPGVYFGYWGGVDVAFYGPLWGWGSFAWATHGIFVDPVRVGLISGGAVVFAGGIWAHDPARRGFAPGFRAAALRGPMHGAAAGRAFARAGGPGFARGFRGPPHGFAGPRHAFHGPARGFAGPGRAFAGRAFAGRGGPPRGFAGPHGGPRGFGGGRAHLAFAGGGPGFGGHGFGGHGFGGGHGHGPR